MADRDQDPLSSVNRWLAEAGSSAAASDVVTLVQGFRNYRRPSVQIATLAAEANLTIGARAWISHARGLQSLVTGFIYPTGKAPMASDNGHPTKLGISEEAHIQSLMRDRGLGYFAFATMEDAFRRGDRGFFGIYGYVAMWGVIIEHENGYRAQYSYPLSITYMSNEMSPVGRTIEHYAELYNIHAERRQNYGNWKALEREAHSSRHRSQARNLTGVTGEKTVIPGTRSGKTCP